MARLDIDRQQELAPERMDYAKQQIEAMGFKITYQDKTKLNFRYNGSAVHFYPYSGWHTGKTIKDGRGIENLLKQLI